MSYSGGNSATKVGINCRNIARASRLARVTLALSEADRIGNNNATVSSSRRMLDARARSARARCFGFSCAVASEAWTNTRIRTSSALGGGSSAASVLGSCSGKIEAPLDIRRKPHGCRAASLATVRRVNTPARGIATNDGNLAVRGLA